VGFEPLSPIDPTQLTDFITRQKRQNGHNPGIEVHAGYAAERPPQIYLNGGGGGVGIFGPTENT
jgi:hypothetical protein